MTTINGESYWDGGLFNNTPLLPVIERLDPDPNVQKHVVVINLFPNQGKVPRQMLDVFDRMFELIFSNKLIMDVKTARKVDEFLEALNEIERSLPDDAKQKIQSLPGYQRLRQYRMIKNLMVIENTEPELVFGPFDFSRKSLMKRISAGYDAAVKKLGPVPTG
jgi:predicted acylesterase/phospholipase RssA